VLALLRSRLLVDFMVVVRRPVFGPGRIPSPLQRVARPSLVVFGRRRWRRSHGSSWFVISRSRVSPPARNFFSCARTAPPSSSMAIQEPGSIHSPPVLSLGFAPGASGTRARTLSRCRVWCAEPGPDFSSSPTLGATSAPGSFFADK
jgi:hypothetical protein